MPTHIQSGEKIVFIGDSITDCGRFEERHRPLGCGYVRYFDDFLKLREPEKRITVINRGIGGNTVDDLRSRWHEDVLLHQPDWLSVKVGINDLNRYLCDKTSAWLSPAGYEEIYEQIMDLTRQKLPATRLLVISPFLLSRDGTTNSYRHKVLDILPEYIAAAQRVAEGHGARFLNLHASFQQRLDLQHPDIFGEEPVHPNQTGHLFIAEEVYRSLS